MLSNCYCTILDLVDGEYAEEGNAWGTLSPLTNEESITNGFEFGQGFVLYVPKQSSSVSLVAGKRLSINGNIYSIKGVKDYNLFRNNYYKAILTLGV